LSTPCRGLHARKSTSWHADTNRASCSRRETYEALEQQVGPYNDDYRSRLAKYKTAPHVLFNAMVAPYTDLPVTGFVWYQGREQRLARLALRTATGGDDQRVAVAISARQRALPHRATPAVRQEHGPRAPIWSDLRETQQKLADRLPQTYVAVTLDVGQANDIHPTNKRPVAEHLAKLALQHVYGRSQIDADAPRLVSAPPGEDGITLTFDKPVTVDPSGASDFQLANGSRAVGARRSRWSRSRPIRSRWLERSHSPSWSGKRGRTW
jgi:sialate O-acetylesterase